MTQHGGGEPLNNPRGVRTGAASGADWRREEQELTSAALRLRPSDVGEEGDGEEKERVLRGKAHLGHADVWAIF
jgi:hypothetical protein